MKLSKNERRVMSRAMIDMMDRLRAEIDNSYMDDGNRSALTAILEDELREANNLFMKVIPKQ